MAIERFPITPEGYKKLEKELDYLKTVERPAAISTIVETRTHGDHWKNPEYYAAKEKQNYVEAKIQDFESKLSRIEVIDITKIKSNTVQFGATVTIFDEEIGERFVYKIVTDYEVSHFSNRISLSSLLAKAMLNKKVGDYIVVKTPKGNRYFEILKLEFI
jgi:transcription elongation factor GreA